MAFDPNDDFGMDDFNFDDLDFNIEDYTSQVDFDGGQGAADPQVPENDDASGDTGEYTPVRRSEERVHPERKHTRKPAKQKKRGGGVRVMSRLLIVLIYLLVVSIAAYLLATFGWRWGSDLLTLDKPEYSATITLEDSMFTTEQTTDDAGNAQTVYLADMDQVSDLLQSNGLIEYKWLFKLFANFTHKDSKLAPGTYELNTTMDYSALLRNMRASSGSRTTVQLMIREGSTVSDIIALLAENNVATEEELKEAATNYDFDYDFLDKSTLGEENRLEGYLFPDTYEFYQNSDAVTALNKLLFNFRSKIYDESSVDQAKLAQYQADGYDLHDILTIASIIEKETDGKDQNGISSVIYNRLKKNGGTNGKLQMDSTIYYALGDTSRELTAEDLTIDSPYNTYANTGLPQGPICCPGLTAIQAALFPSDTDDYYFVLGDDGSTHFFSDYDSFVAFKNAQTGVIQNQEDGNEEG